MKSDIEIKDDIYQIIKGSTLEKAVTGKLKKTRRPANSNELHHIGDGCDGQAEENSSRLRQLCKLATELLEVQRGEDYRFTLDKQRVMEVNGKNEHFINNKLLYKQVNE